MFRGIDRGCLLEFAKSALKVGWRSLHHLNAGVVMLAGYLEAFLQSFGLRNLGLVLLVRGLCLCLVLRGHRRFGSAAASSCSRAAHALYLLLHLFKRQCRAITRIAN